jgi:uncharacterized protein involved in exopolysaccharide biosynthesis
LSSPGNAPLRRTMSEPWANSSPSVLSDAERENKGNFIRYLRFYWENRRLFFQVAFYGLLCSAAIAFLIPSRYEGTTQLMPPDGQQGMGMALLSSLSGRSAPALGGIAGDLLGVKNSGALFVGILQSRTVADRMIAQFELQRVYHASKPEDARKALAKHTAISEDRKSGILSMTVTDHDPKRAAAMAQAYVAELDRLVAQVGTSSARRERVFLEERLKSVKSDLDEAAKEFSEFASKNTAIDIPAQGKAMVEAAATLQGQLIAAESELRGIEQIYTGNNVRVRSLRARVEELRQQLNKLGGADAAGSTQADKSLYPSIRKLPLLGVTYADLFRRTKIQETVYELLTQQYELAKVQEAKEIPTVKVLDAAVVPTKKSFPPRLLLTLSGTLLAVALAGVFLLIRQRWDEVDPKDPGRLLAVEVGGVVRSRVRRLVPVQVLQSRLVGRWFGGRQPVNLEPKQNAAQEGSAAD